MVTEVEVWYKRVPKSCLSENIIVKRQLCYSQIKDILINELITNFYADFGIISNILNLLILIGNVETAITNVVNQVIIHQIPMEEMPEKNILLIKLFTGISKVIFNLSTFLL